MYLLLFDADPGLFFVNQLTKCQPFSPTETSPNKLYLIFWSFLKTHGCGYILTCFVCIHTHVYVHAYVHVCGRPEVTLYVFSHSPHPFLRQGLSKPGASLFCRLDSRGPAPALG